MTYTISQEEMALLLDRPLSNYETDNFASLLASAKSQLELVLSIRIDGEADAERTYLPREGYNTLWTDPFTELTSVEIITQDSTIALDGTPAYFDDLNADWFNSVILDRPLGSKRLSVKAAWGFGENLPTDLAKLWAGLFGIASSVADTEPTGAVTSEQILTHKVTFADASADVMARWAQANSLVIARYSTPKSTVYGSGDGLSRHC